MMFDEVLPQLNYGIIFLAAAASFVVGALWYSPLILGKEWLKEMNMTEEDIKKKGAGEMNLIYLMAFVQTLLKALFLAILFRMLGVSNVYLGTYLGLFVCVGFTATSIGVNYLFEDKSMEVTWISVSHHMAAFMAMGAILGMWG